MPDRVLEPYMRAIESLQIRNILTVASGAQHTRTRGIPQGCPFSMTLTALLVRPWTQKLLRRGAIPRVLADDLHVVVAGDEHHDKHFQAIRDTHIFTTAERGRIAASKSYGYSTDKRTSKQLAKTRLMPCRTPGFLWSHTVGTWEDRST